VYVLPDTASLRIWHGVIFVRKGIYANGIFKFRVNLPLHYGDPQVWPAITFTSKVFNPLVHPESGEVDLTLLLPSWDPRTGSCMLTALTYLKKVSKVISLQCVPAARCSVVTLLNADKPTCSYCQ
jgi:ubiquitin-protein ligase